MIPISDGKHGGVGMGGMGDADGVRWDSHGGAAA